MKHVTLPGGQEISALGLGTWRMGEDAELLKVEADVLRHGLDAGLNLIDTAEMYGEGGAEMVVAEALNGRREEAYIVSKVWVLAALGATQVILLQGTVEWQIQLRGPLPLELLALFGASVAGTGLGLVVSALATTQERAVFAVPLLLLPQILFSQLAIPDTLYSDVVAAVEKVMPVHWAFRVFEESAALEPRWHMVALYLIILFAIGAVLVAVASMALLPRREVVT